jgi:hypothetical protein
VPATLPIASQPALDVRVLILAALFTALTGLGFGLFPALRAAGRTGLPRCAMATAQAAAASSGFGRCSSPSKSPCP